MNDTPYARFDADDLSLRDELAIDRTLLANERTLLAYLRSGVALLIAGATIMHFAAEGWFWGMGLACVPLGIGNVIIGVIRYRRMHKAISGARPQARTGTTPDNEPAIP